jgi:phosphatidylglycerophosphatase A
VGSLTGVALFVLAASSLPGPRVVALAGLVVLCPVAVWACGAEAARRGITDPGPVVADEVAGQWLALTVLVMVTTHRPTALDLGGSFLLFRLFDIVKPWPIRSLERLPGGWGVVADDLAAGLAAGLVHLGIRWVLA